MTTEPTRRERKKEETRSRIFKAAIRLFRDRGFEATTVDDITEKADVAKGTFFNYFPKKEAVLAYFSELRLDQVEENAEAILSGARSIREKLLEIYTFAASDYAEDRELSRFVIIELMKRSFTPSEHTENRWCNLILGILRQGQESGEIRRDVNLERAESLLGSVYMATLYLWACCIPGHAESPCVPFGDFNLRDELRARLELVLDGIAVPGGAR